MASGKRASMREGPLAQLFRKTEEDEARPEQKPRQEERPAEERPAEERVHEHEPKLGRPLPEGGPAPQVTRHVPEPQAQTEHHDLGGRRTEAARRAQEREELNPDIEIEGILPTLVDNRTVHAKEAVEILEENFGDRVFASRINKTVRFAEAPVKGMSVLKYDPNGKAAYAYRRLAEEVLANGKR